MQSHEISEEDLKNSPYLQIFEIHGKILQNSPLIINPFGMIDGARKKNDGITFFGSKIYDGDFTLNDVVLEIEENKCFNLKQLFTIFYRRGIISIN